MDDYEIADVREQEMLESIGARVLAPVSRGLLDLARRITPVGYTENVKRKIVLAGSPPGYEVDRFLILKVLGFASGIVWIALAVDVPQRPPPVRDPRRAASRGACASSVPTSSSTAGSRAAARRSSAGCPTRSTCS